MRRVAILIVIALYGCTTTSRIENGEYGLTTGTKELIEDLLICFDSEADERLPPIKLLNRYVGQTVRTCPGMVDRGVLEAGSEIRIDALERHTTYGPKSVVHAYAIGVASYENGEEFSFHMHLGFLPDYLLPLLWADP